MFVPTLLRLSLNFLLIFYCTVFLYHPHSKCIPANVTRPRPSHFRACFSFLWWPKIQTAPTSPHLRGNEYWKSNVWRFGFVLLSVYLIFIKQSSLKWGGLFLFWMHGCFCGMHPSFCSHLLLLLQKKKNAIWLRRWLDSICLDQKGLIESDGVKKKIFFISFGVKSHYFVEICFDLKLSPIHPLTEP